MKERRSLVEGLSPESSVDRSLEEQFVFAGKKNAGAPHTPARDSSRRGAGREGATGKHRQPRAVDNADAFGLCRRPQTRLPAAAAGPHLPQYPSGHSGGSARTVAPGERLSEVKG